MHLSRVLFLISFICSFELVAYIPKAEMLFQRACQRHGRGGYQINMEVTFTESQTPEALKNGEKPKVHLMNEKWIIQNADSMRVEITGRSRELIGFRKVFVYQDGQRYYLKDGQVASSSQHPWLVERYFHYRHPDNFKKALVEGKFLPESILEEKEPLQTLEGYESTPEEFTALDRVGGTVAIAFFQPVDPTLAQAPSVSRFWLEQDQFLIQKIRWSDNSLMQARDYKQHKGNLWFPESRTLQWAEHKVEVKTLSVSQIQIGPKTKALLQPRSLLEAPNSPQDSQVTLSSFFLKEFYKRFR